jgi:hypothetical protein
MVDWAAGNWRGGIINNKRDIKALANFGNLGNRKNIQLWIGQGLGEISAGFLVG